LSLEFYAAPRHVKARRLHRSRAMIRRVLLTLFLFVSPLSHAGVFEDLKAELEVLFQDARHRHQLAENPEQEEARTARLFSIAKDALNSQSVEDLKPGTEQEIYQKFSRAKTESEARILLGILSERGEIANQMRSQSDAPKLNPDDAERREFDNLMRVFREMKELQSDIAAHRKANGPTLVVVGNDSLDEAKKSKVELPADLNRRVGDKWVPATAENTTTDELRRHIANQMRRLEDSMLALKESGDESGVTIFVQRAAKLSQTHGSLLPEALSKFLQKIAQGPQAPNWWNRMRHTAGRLNDRTQKVRKELERWREESRKAAERRRFDREVRRERERLDREYTRSYGRISYDSYGYDRRRDDDCGPGFRALKWGMGSVGVVAVAGVGYNLYSNNEDAKQFAPRGHAPTPKQIAHNEAVRSNFRTATSRGVFGSGVGASGHDARVAAAQRLESLLSYDGSHPYFDSHLGKQEMEKVIQDVVSNERPGAEIAVPLMIALSQVSQSSAFFAEVYLDTTRPLAVRIAALNKMHWGAKSELKWDLVQQLLTDLKNSRGTYDEKDFARALAYAYSALSYEEPTLRERFQDAVDAGLRKRGVADKEYVQAASSIFDETPPPAIASMVRESLLKGESRFDDTRLWKGLQRERFKTIKPEDLAKEITTMQAGLSKYQKFDIWRVLESVDRPELIVPMMKNEISDTNHAFHQQSVIVNMLRKRYGFYRAIPEDFKKELLAVEGHTDGQYSGVKVVRELIEKNERNRQRWIDAINGGLAEGLPGLLKVDNYKLNSLVEGVDRDGYQALRSAHSGGGWGSGTSLRALHLLAEIRREGIARDLKLRPEDRELFDRLMRPEGATIKDLRTAIPGLLDDKSPEYLNALEIDRGDGPRVESLGTQYGNYSTSLPLVEGARMDSLRGLAPADFSPTRDSLGAHRWVRVVDREAFYKSIEDLKVKIQ
jgi:hypothetical protein